MSEISSFSGRYHFLSNFHMCEVFLDGTSYPSTEHAYQAAKTHDLDARQLIRELPTPGMTKKLGRSVVMRPDWDAVKIEVMAELLWQKFTLHPDLARRLLDTGDATLIEGNYWGDTFWGICKGVGHNHLGKLLMSVRSALREDLS